MKKALVCKLSTKFDSETGKLVNLWRLQLSNTNMFLLLSLQLDKIVPLKSSIHLKVALII